MWTVQNKPGDIRIMNDDGEIVHRAKDVGKSLTHFAFCLQEGRRLRAAVEQDIAQLETWAAESVKGGWSTHQVDAMRKRADELRRVLFPGKMIEVPTGL